MRLLNRNGAQATLVAGQLVELVFVPAVAEHFGRDDLVGRRRIRALRIALLQFAEHVHAFDHAAEDGVLAVEMRRLHEREKELRAARVAAGVGHAQAAAKMVAVVRLVAFAADRVAGSAGAVALRDRRLGP